MASDKDKHGREYARVASTKAGDLIQVDGDFTCIHPWLCQHVQIEEKGLYLFCDDGQHFLNGQLNDDGTFYIGIYPIELPNV